MITLTIPQEQQKRFQKIFKTLNDNNCEVSLFPEGLKYRNKEVEGIVYKTAFIDYPVQKTKPLGVLDIKNQDLKNWFGKWKEVPIDYPYKMGIEIPIK